MQIILITTRVQSETLITNYANWQTRFMPLQSVPGIGIIGCFESINGWLPALDRRCNRHLCNPNPPPSCCWARMLCPMS